MPTQALVSKEQRTHAKRLLYGCIYGMGAAALAADLRVPLQEAKRLMRSFADRYPGIRKWSAGEANGPAPTAPAPTPTPLPKPCTLHSALCTLRSRT